MAKRRPLPRPFMTTDAKVRVCRCGAPVLHAIDEGIPAVVDPWPAERITEATAIILGRWTYTLVLKHLYRREGSIHRGPVLIQHRCGRPLTSPAAFPQPPPPNDIPPY
jgi:hypothetical protein